MPQGSQCFWLLPLSLIGCKSFHHCVHSFSQIGEVLFEQLTICPRNHAWQFPVWSCKNVILRMDIEYVRAKNVYKRKHIPVFRPSILKHFDLVVANISSSCSVHYAPIWKDSGNIYYCSNNIQHCWAELALFLSVFASWYLSFSFFAPLLLAAVCMYLYIWSRALFTVALDTRLAHGRQSLPSTAVSRRIFVHFVADVT